MENVKKLMIYLSLMLMVATFFSCSLDRNDGDWDDNIQLSQRDAAFSAENDSILITTKGKWWWIGNVSLDGNQVEFDGTNSGNSEFIIETLDFKIERKNTTELHIAMKKNETGVARVLIIGLQAGNYFDGIKITQAKN